MIRIGWSHFQPAEETLRHNHAIVTEWDDRTGKVARQTEVEDRRINILVVVDEARVHINGLFVA